MPYGNKDAKNIVEKRKRLQQMMIRNRISTFRRMKLDPSLSPGTKMNSKWIKDLRMNHETLTLLEENLRYRCRQDSEFSICPGINTNN